MTLLAFFTVSDQWNPRSGERVFYLRHGQRRKRRFGEGG